MTSRTLFVALVLAALAASAARAQQCTVSAPSPFAPPGGAMSYGPAGKFRSGYATQLALLPVPGVGSPEIALQENYGYTIWDLSSPASPRVAYYCDLEGTYPKTGDGFSTVYSVGASTDGSRILVGYIEPHGVLVLGRNDRACGLFGGEYGGSRSTGVAAVTAGSRTVAVSTFNIGGAALGDVTVTGAITDILPSAPLAAAPPAASGTLVLAGRFAVYATNEPTQRLAIADLASPLAGGALGAASVHVFSAAQVGLPAGDLVASVAAAIHPVDGKLYVLVEGGTGAGPFRSDGFALVSTADGANLTPAGARWAPPGSYYATGASTAVATTSDALFFTWLQSGSQYKLVTLSAAAWGIDQTSGADGIASATLGQIRQAKALFAGGSQLYLYTAASQSAWAQTLSCTPPPATPLGFYPVPPCRLFDTRSTAPLAGGEVRRFGVAGNCAIPADARSLAVNVTATGAATAGSLSLFAGDSALPPTAMQAAFPAGKARAAMSQVELARDGSGTLKVLNGGAGSVDVILDVTGFFR